MPKTIDDSGLVLYDNVEDLILDVDPEDFENKRAWAREVHIRILRWRDKLRPIPGNPGRKYFLLTAGNDIRNEYTNVGVLLFDVATGNKIGHKVDGARATARGDIKPEWNLTNERLDKIADSYKTFKDVERAWGSMGHAMSAIQIHQGGGTIITDDERFLSETFREYVLGPTTGVQWYGPVNEEKK